MPATYEPIATYTTPSTTASYTFSSIPGTYTDIVLVANGSSTAGTNGQIRFNGDTASNYSDTYLYGSAGAAYSSRDTSATAGYIGNFYSGDDAQQIVHINSYANTTTYKSYVSIGGNANNVPIASNVGLWRSTAAITSITVLNPTSTFKAGCVFTLYGIKAA